MSTATTPPDSPDPEDQIEDWVYPSTDEGAHELSDRQLLFLKRYLETGNLVASMRAAGYQGDDETLRVNGYHVRRRLKKTVPALLRANNITVTLIFKTFFEAMTAYKVTRIKVKEPYTYEDSRGKERTGFRDEIREFYDIDHGTRIRAGEIGARLYGFLDRHPSLTPGQPGQSPVADITAQIGGLLGIEAEEDFQAEEEQERATVSDRELRGDIDEMKRKLRLIGYELVPTGGANVAAMPNAKAPASVPDSSVTNRTEKPKP